MTQDRNSNLSARLHASSEAANDNIVMLRPKIRQWALSQKQLPPLQKAFLMVGANLVDERGECFLLNSYFQSYLNMSRRCVQNYLRTMERENLIELTGVSRKRNGTQVPLYRFAPGDEQINGLRNASKRPAPCSQVEVRSTKRTSLRPQMKELKEDGSIEPSDHPERFDDACDRYPELGLQRTDFREARRLWALHSTAIGEDRLIQAIETYGKSPDRVGDRYVPGLDGWLTKERFRGYLPTSKGTDETQSWPAEGNVPHWLRSDFLCSFSEPWVRAWLLPCLWDADQRTLLPRTATAGERLAREGRSVLARHDVTVLPKGPA